MNRKQIAIAFIVVSAVCFALYLYGRDFRKSVQGGSFEGRQNVSAYHYETLYTVKKATCYYY